MKRIVILSAALVGIYIGLIYMIFRETSLAHHYGNSEL